MALAKVGNPLRDEPLQTSKSLCHFKPEDAELLTTCFLKPFKSLDAHQFKHHEGVDRNEVYRYTSEIFDNGDSLLEMGRNIANHLYARSRHPNIKSGDLCVAVINDVEVSGEKCQGLCIVKSESKVPFRQIALHEGDLRLTTQRGIYPDKIDKGCLIVNREREAGYLVYMFDKGGATPHFWNRDFLGVEPRRNDDFLTKRYADLCVAFAKDGLPEETEEEERLEIANRSISYLEDEDEFDLQRFRDYALKEPDLVEKFDEFKTSYEEEKGEELEEAFTVAKPVAVKAKKRLKGKIKTDTGAQLYFSSQFIDEAGKYLQRGFDDNKQMHFLKVYYNSEVE